MKVSITQGWRELIDVLSGTTKQKKEWLVWMWIACNFKHVNKIASSFKHVGTLLLFRKVNGGNLMGMWDGGYMHAI